MAFQSKAKTTLKPTQTKRQQPSKPTTLKPENKSDDDKQHVDNRSAHEETQGNKASARANTAEGAEERGKETAQDQKPKKEDKHPYEMLTHGAVVGEDDDTCEKGQLVHLVPSEVDRHRARGIAIRGPLTPSQVKEVTATYGYLEEKSLNERNDDAAKVNKKK